jgi:hypothetical protein
LVEFSISIKVAIEKGIPAVFMKNNYLFPEYLRFGEHSILNYKFLGYFDAALLIVVKLSLDATSYNLGLHMITTDLSFDR